MRARARKVKIGHGHAHGHGHGKGNMYVLGIESTCDETACAIVKDGKDILSNIVYSQVDVHKAFGGVVPELSCRTHVELLIPMIDKALKEARLTLSEIDLIAVAHAPGLVGALLIGLNAAKALSLALGIPFVGVNHVEAHLYAALMSNQQPPSYPCLGVVLSGGHTALWKILALGNYSLIGHTIDDAIGEAFDKVARMLSLPYPGGPPIEELATKGDPTKFAFRAGNIKGKPFDFSFSGLKTAVLYALKEITPTETTYADIAASFQEAAFKDILNKTILATSKENIQDILFGGGVANNQYLRKLFQTKAPHLKCYFPSKALSLDNAAMIAGLGYHIYDRRGHISDVYTLQCQTRLPLANFLE